ncbi:MAG: ribbon-helix-helix domain-containing protein [Byssovorax sp.]
MAKTKVAVTIEAELVERVDALVRAHLFPSRSQVIEIALTEKIAGMERGRLARECAKLNAGEEQALADEGYSEDTGAWPAY